MLQNLEGNLSPNDNRPCDGLAYQIVDKPCWKWHALAFNTLYVLSYFPDLSAAFVLISLLQLGHQWSSSGPTCMGSRCKADSFYPAEPVATEALQPRGHAPLAPAACATFKGLYAGREPLPGRVGEEFLALLPPSPSEETQAHAALTLWPPWHSPCACMCMSWLFYFSKLTPQLTTNLIFGGPKKLWPGPAHSRLKVLHVEQRGACLGPYRARGGAWGDLLRLCITRLHCKRAIRVRCYLCPTESVVIPELWSQNLCLPLLPRW